MAIQSIPVEWSVINAADSFDTISTTNKKIQSSECKDTGLYPVIDQGQKYIAGYIDDDSKVIIVHSPLVVFGDHTKAMKLVDFNFAPGADGTKILNPKKFIDPTFFYHQLKNLDIPDKGYARHFKFFKELDFFLPPAAEQKEIADRLDKLLAQVAATQARLVRIPDIIKQFRQSVLAAAVSGKLTEEWRKNNSSQFPYSVSRLSDVIHEMRNGLSSKPNENGEGYPILRISSVRSFSLDQVDVRYLDVSKKDQERYELKQNDLLFTRYNGSVDFVGACARIKNIEHDVLLYPDKLIRVRVDNRKIMPEYLEIFTASQGARDYILSLVKSTSGQKGISGTDLKQLQVKLPSVSEQTEIVRRVEELFAFTDTIEQQVKAAKERVDNLTQAILAKAFRGELTADWRAANPDLISGDNSAEALLARIQAERAQSAKKGRKSTQPAP